MTKRPQSPRRSPRRIASTISAIAAVVVAALAGWLLWRRAAPPPLRSGTCAGCNLLLITIDTLRTDRVGAFGGPSNLTPTLDRLASDGLMLTRAYASAPLTLPSHTSILTAVSPPVHGVRANGLFRLGPKLPTLATVLRSAGYRTGAFVGAFVLDARFGLTRGFDVYDDRYGEKHAGDPTEGAERRAEDVIKPAIRWILDGTSESATSRPREAPSASAAIEDYARAPRREGVGERGRGPASDKKWFAWIHFYDPHEPYRAPEPFASRHQPYDAEVAYTDATIATLLESLRSVGQLDRTLLVVASDHGESLGEHGERTHGVFVYDVTMRVPWIIAGPHVHHGVNAALVRLIDLAPTTLDLLGIERPAEFEGRSVVKGGERTAYVEAMDANLTRNWAPLTGIVSGHSKLIDLPIPEMYDLSADPREMTNVHARDPALARVLESLLRDGAAAQAARASNAERTTLSADARQRLQALGYVAASAGVGPRVYTDADDPKMLIGPAEDLNRALIAFRAGSRDEAMSAVRSIIQAHPGFTTSYGVLASMQRDTGDLKGAIALLETVVRRNVADQSTMVVLAGYLQEAGALQQAADLLEAVVAAHPDYADALNSLGVVYSRLGRHDRARRSFRQVLELDPTSATAYENLGVDAMGAGDLSSAADDLSRALELDPALARAHNALAAVYMRQHREDDAVAHWRTALTLDPTLYDALYNIGVSLWDGGRPTDAQPYLERFVREAPPQRYAADIAHVRKLIRR
jgi:arylsulfatase A-like enzyme/Tfp pilus assembly protein PilF